MESILQDLVVDSSESKADDDDSGESKADEKAVDDDDSGERKEADTFERSEELTAP